MNFEFEKHWINLVCLIPVYDQDGGNSTEIWLKGGEKILIPKKTRSVLKRLAKVFAIDLPQLKRKYGVLVGRKSSTPLPFHPNLILVPVKVREPLAKDDGSWGYVVKDQVYSCVPLSSTEMEIRFLDNEHPLRCLQSAASFNLVMAHAEIITRECYKQWNIIREREELYQVVSTFLSSLENKKNTSYECRCL